MTYLIRRPYLHVLAHPVLGKKKVATPWYLAGGISAANCVAAYQPKGAANQNASYINLANPGTYNAAPGTAPAWDASNGWKFDAASNHYLTTGITPANDQSWSAIARFSNGNTDVNQMIMLAQGLDNSTFGISNCNGGKRDYFNGSHKATGVSSANGIIVIAGTKGYFNATEEVTGIESVPGSLVPLFIGCKNHKDALRSIYLTGFIQALAIYNVTLTPEQIGALTTAMGAL